jgi:hypothetical protein
VALLEVSNRGGKAALPYFARAAWSVDPAVDADFGDALPLRLGLTLIWVGWQFDVPTPPASCGWTRRSRPTAAAPSTASCAATGRWTSERPACRSVIAATGRIPSWMPTTPTTC